MQRERETQSPDPKVRDDIEKAILNQRMNRIKNKILVLSGKGGVGKSTIAVNIAASLSLAGKRVGLLDIDIHGPSVPKLICREKSIVTGTESSLVPVDYSHNLKVMSIGFMLRGRDDAIIWRGPLKHRVIKQFLMNVEWGTLEYLIVDSPPGTGDEPLSIAQFMAKEARAVIVTTPQEIALLDVRKCICFCRKVSLSILGVVENMSGFTCPKCGEISDIFKSGGGEELARSMGVPFLGKIPMDPKIVQVCDSGEPFVSHYAKTDTAKAFENILKPVLEMDESRNKVAS